MAWMNSHSFDQAQWQSQCLIPDSPGSRFQPDSATFLSNLLSGIYTLTRKALLNESHEGDERVWLKAVVLQL